MLEHRNRSSGTSQPLHDDLIDHLVRTAPLRRGEAARVVLDVLAYFDE